MKITPEILKSMDFTELGDKVYSLKSHQVSFTIEDFGTYWRFRNHSDGHGHSITDVEEMISFALHDGYDMGVIDTKKQIREFLGDR